MMRFLLIMFFGLNLVLNAGGSFAEEVKTVEHKEDTITKVFEKTLGKDIKITRVEDPTASSVSGLKQIRVWFESVYGETPLLFYMTDDGKAYIAGSIFDSDGNNITSKDVGKTKPRVIEASEMDIRDEYRIGNENAVLRIVLWMGTDKISVKIFNTLHKIYLDNKEKVVIDVKFHPSQDNQQDYFRTVALSCFKNNIEEGFRFLSSAAPAWGQTKKDIDLFIKDKGYEDCDGRVVREDIKHAQKLRLPVHQVVLVNGNILLDDITKDNIVKIAGIELK